MASSLSRLVRPLLGLWQTPLLALVVVLDLVAMAVGLWGGAAASPLWPVLLGACGLLLVAALAWALLVQLRGQEQIRRVVADSELPQQELEKVRAQARAGELRLREVIDALPAGVAVYDNQDRLVSVNQEALHQVPYQNVEHLVGESYEALMRRALSAGRIPDAVGREEEWLALRLAGRGAPGPGGAPLLRHSDDGHWVHFYETRTPSGYLVMTRLDITPIVEKGLALERANEQLLRLSTTDGLTGIANRRLFDQTLQSEWQRCARYQSNLALLIVDIDHFKRYNDHYGHLTGDECLRQVARILAMCVKRSGELVARYGGEEFAVLLPGADVAEASRVAQRCILEMQNARIPHADSPVSPWLSVSVGVASMVATPEVPPTTLVQQADTAMYKAKNAGRARFEVFA